MTSTATSQKPLGLAYAEYTTNTPLQSIILDVVDNIVSQESRGAWTVVVAKRISLNGFYSQQEVRREIERMIKAGSLYESCYDILDGILFMNYVRNGNEIKSYPDLGGDALQHIISEIKEGKVKSGRPAKNSNEKTKKANEVVTTETNEADLPCASCTHVAVPPEMELEYEKIEEKLLLFIEYLISLGAGIAEIKEKFLKVLETLHKK